MKEQIKDVKQGMNRSTFAHTILTLFSAYTSVFNICMISK